MESKWLIYEGDNGIDAIFDEVKNKSKKHVRDDALVPFKTKTDKNEYSGLFYTIVPARGYR